MTSHKHEPYKIKPFGSQPDVLIAINNEDIIRYRYLVQQVRPNEVQWYAKVKRVVFPAEQRSKHNKQPLYVYYISDMFIPEQEVSGGSTDTDVRKDPMRMYNLLLEIEKRHADDSELGFNQEAANADIQAMHCWCHSHPFTNNPGPSGQDDNMFNEWVQENQIAQKIDTPMVALIFGSGEKIHGRIYDPHMPGIMYDDVDVEIDCADNFDTSYIDEAIDSKINQKKWTSNKGSGNQTMVKCSDGTWRFKHNAAEFEAKVEAELNKKDPQTLETSAAEFFNKHFDGDWNKFIKLLNSKYQNDKEILELWDFMGHWLKEDLEKTMFALALTALPSHLLAIAEGDQDDLFLLNDDDAKIVLVGHFDSDTLSSLQLKSALTFAKRYFRAKDQMARVRAVSAWKNTMEKVPLQIEVYEAAAGVKSYGFLDDDDPTSMIPYGI